MTATFAPAIGLAVGNILYPVTGMNLPESTVGEGAELAEMAPRIRRTAGLRTGHPT